MARGLGILMLILVLGVGLGMSTYIVFELGGMETVSNYFTDAFYIDLGEKDTPAESADVDAFTEKGVEYNDDERKHTINIKEDVLPAITRIVHRMLEIPVRIAFSGADFWSSNISITAYEQEIQYVGTDFYSPLFYPEKFAVYSQQLGVIDSYEMEVMQSFASSASEWDNPLGADTYGILRNSQLEVKRRLVMQPGETDNFKLIYTIKNLGGPYFKDKTKLSYVNVKSEMLAPAFADIDGDGDLDMLVGDVIGDVYYYKNMGNRTDPYFVPDDSPLNSSDSNLFSNVSIDGCNMGIKIGCSISPSFADLDGDGDYDIVIGRADDIALTFYENKGTSANPVWQEWGIFSFMNATGGYDADFADFDNDGDLDMIAAHDSGLTYYENTGSATAPNWISRWVNSFGFSNYTLKGVEATDFDGDGDYDLLAGSRTYASRPGVKLIENIGTASSPSFSFVNNFTIDHGAKMPAGIPPTYGFSYNENFGMAAADLDGDGDDDLVIGNSNSTLTYYSKGYDKIEDLYFYEIPFMDLYDPMYNGTVYYDPVTDSFTLSMINPDSTLVIYGDKASSKHGIQGNRWIHPWAWHMYGNPCLEPYPLGEDLYWTDGELNGLDRYTVNGNVGERYSCNSNNYNTSQQVAPVLGFLIGDLEIGEEKSITITYKFALGRASRADPDLTINGVMFLGDNVSFNVLNTGTAAVNPMIELVDYFNDNVVKSTSFTLNSSVKNVNVVFKVDNKHKVAVIADPLNKIVESDENNNIASAERKKYSVFLNVSMGSLNDVFTSYVLSKLSNYNVVNDMGSADYVLYIGGEDFNNETLNNGFGIDGYALWFGKKGFKPYNGFVNALDEKVFVRGVSVDGVAAALKYVDWAALSNSKHYVSDDDKLGLQVFDYFRTASNQPSIYKDNDEFKEIVHESLFGKYVESNETVKTLQGVVLNLKHLANTNGDLLKEYLNVSSYPVVMAGGLWSDINAWKGLGQELADNGRDVWLAEITGGNNTECPTCADYTYSDVVNYHMPAIVGGVVQYTGESKIQWVGHSNAGRAGLDFLTAHGTGMNPAGQYWDGDSYEFDSFAANPVETYVGVGVPGAFEGDSPAKIVMQDRGWETIIYLENRSKNHFTQAEFILAGKLLENIIPKAPSGKISLNLIKNYFNWMNSTLDVQPAQGLTINNSAIIGGTSCMASDCVIPTIDQDAIYGNINIPSPGTKRHFEWPAGHSSLLDEFWVNSIISKTLNKENLNFIENLGKKDEQINP